MRPGRLYWPSPQWAQLRVEYELPDLLAQAYCCGATAAEMDPAIDAGVSGLVAACGRVAKLRVTAGGTAVAVIVNGTSSVPNKSRMISVAAPIVLGKPQVWSGYGR